MNSRITSSLEPETLSSVVLLALPDDQRGDGVVQGSIEAGKSTWLLVEALTLLGQIAGRGGGWHQVYTSLVARTAVQDHLAKAIVEGDCHLKRATLSLVGTVGFTTDRYFLFFLFFF